MQQKEKRVFVTVGTTKFEKLIETASSAEILDILHKLGYTFVQYQTGSGNYAPKTHEAVTLAYDTYFENFEEEIAKSHLVISHAGAGSCLEILRRQKPLVVVINDSLMNNHQTELAEQLQKDGYVYCCTCNTLQEALVKDFSTLKKYPTPPSNIFSSYLDACMGFVNVKSK